MSPDVALAVSLALASAGTAAGPVLRDIPSLEAFRAAFNEDAGRPRLILLLSPT